MVGGTGSQLQELFLAVAFGQGDGGEHGVAAQAGLSQSAYTHAFQTLDLLQGFVLDALRPGCGVFDRSRFGSQQGASGDHLSVTEVAGTE